MQKMTNLLLEELLNEDRNARLLISENESLHRHVKKTLLKSLGKIDTGTDFTIEDIIVFRWVGSDNDSISVRMMLSDGGPSGHAIDLVYYLDGKRGIESEYENFNSKSNRKRSTIPTPNELSAIRLATKGKVIDLAKRHYREYKKQQKEMNESQRSSVISKIIR